MDASWGALQERAANAARAAECLDPEENTGIPAGTKGYFLGFNLQAWKPGSEQILCTRYMFSKKGVRKTSSAQGQVRVLQRFYDQLCALVEAQRMSDPLSLMVVHTVSVCGVGEKGTGQLSASLP
eukprot:411300-Pelagomonas_calceolata.AAC.4